MSRELIESFYRAFQRRDAEAMAALYSDDVRFSDPAFGPLVGEHARNMWRMLTARATDLELTFSDVTESTAHWEARYTFTQTGKKVHNIIDARFEFKAGKIARHDDVFDFWRWSRQALGAPGLLLGWTPLLQNAVRKKALAGLAAFEAKR
jgi:ketosteroid isomerase-like protein